MAVENIGAKSVGLLELLGNSDIISLHVHLMEATRKLIDESAIARMKPGPILINASRCGIVDEVALEDGLHSQHLRRAAVDVFSEETPKADNILI